MIVNDVEMIDLSPQGGEIIIDQEHEFNIKWSQNISEIFISERTFILFY